MGESEEFSIGAIYLTRSPVTVTSAQYKGDEHCKAVSKKQKRCSLIYGLRYLVENWGCSSLNTGEE